MTDDEWEASPPGEAMTAFKRYIYNLLGVVMAGGIGGLLTGAMSAVLKAMIPARDAALIDANYQKSQMLSLARVMGPPFCHEHGTGCFRLLAVW
ncbi:hypothetical protein [Mycobacterium intracellulare]|uniref:hypothetical protein n=1 Tax=Mycobacterium intracellulare TaxID=1767 RepID=UPI00192885D6|nr:hypothetical protein [Mycobacterium intracellulare]